jgi:hypothetical protein
MSAEDTRPGHRAPPGFSPFRRMVRAAPFPACSLIATAQFKFHDFPPSPRLLSVVTRFGQP